MSSVFVMPVKEDLLYVCRWRIFPNVDKVCWVIGENEGKCVLRASNRCAGGFCECMLGTILGVWR